MGPMEPRGPGCPGGPGIPGKPGLPFGPGEPVIREQLVSATPPRGGQGLWLTRVCKPLALFLSALCPSPADACTEMSQGRVKCNAPKTDLVTSSGLVNHRSASRNLQVFLETSLFPPPPYLSGDQSPCVLPLSLLCLVTDCPLNARDHRQVVVTIAGWWFRVYVSGPERPRSASWTN